MVGSVLLVDTDVDVLRSVGAVFEQAGYEVLRELSAEAALETYERLAPDVVLLDWPFDAREDHDLLDHMVKQGATVLLTTEGDETEVALRGIEQGAAGFLVKPLSTDQLVAVTSRAADDARLRAGIWLHPRASAVSLPNREVVFGDPHGAVRRHGDALGVFDR